MHYQIAHRTVYRYVAPAAEAYAEARLTPPDMASQTIRSRLLELDPPAKVSPYTDHRGNVVEFFSLPYRHESLTVVNRVSVVTSSPEMPEDALNVPVAEARQLLHSAMVDIFDYLQPTAATPELSGARRWARRHFRPARPLGEAIAEVNSEIHRRFTYLKGATDIWTPLAKVWSQRKGVCQDFAHVMLTIVRAAGFPARYVCGYIEGAPPRRGAAGELLAGAFATHAWVEVLVPGMRWVACDPTNSRFCGEQHVTVSRGCDAREAAPLRGTFKGSGTEAMKVEVRVRRIESPPEESP